MKTLLITLFTLTSATSFSIELESVNPHYAPMKKIELDESRTLVQYPFLKNLGRESVGDVVYFGKNYSGNKICAHLGLGEYERGSKVIVVTRAVSTGNLVLNQIGYRFDPIGRLAEDYQYPKTKIVKEIVCSNQ
jgi:hypothetical protein